MERHHVKQGIKDFGAGTLLVIGVVVVALVIGSGVWLFRVATADVKGKGDQIIQTKGNADYRIAAYDAFYDACGAIQAKEDQIALQQDLLDGLKPGDLDYTRLQTNVVALQSSRASLIRSYNADASKADTRAAFHASDLPYSIDPAQETTTCAR